jgi:hypothetical protein
MSENTSTPTPTDTRQSFVQGLGTVLQNMLNTNTQQTNTPARKAVHFPSEDEQTNEKWESLASLIRSHEALCEAFVNMTTESDSEDEDSESDSESDSEDEEDTEEDTEADDA